MVNGHDGLLDCIQQEMPHVQDFMEQDYYREIGYLIHLQVGNLQASTPENGLKETNFLAQISSKNL